MSLLVLQASSSLHKALFPPRFLQRTVATSRTSARRRRIRGSICSSFMKSRPRSSSLPSSSPPSSSSSARIGSNRVPMEDDPQQRRMGIDGPLRPNASDRVQQILNASSRWVVVASVIAVVVWRHDENVCWAVIGGILNAASSKLLKRLFNQQRPLTALGLKADPGMPSSHAQSLGFFSLYASLGLILWQGPHFLPIAASVAIILFGLYLTWLRVSRGLHTPMQVTVGIGFGYSMAGLWIGLWNYMVRDVVASSIAMQYTLVSIFLLSSLCFAIFALKEWRLADA